MEKFQKNLLTKKTKGFTLTELLTTLSIFSVIGSIAVPAYLDQKQRMCQTHAQSIVNQALLLTQAHKDELRYHAEGWNDLDKIGAIMTKYGPASGSVFSEIHVNSCDYALTGKRDNNEYIFEARRRSNSQVIDPEIADPFNVMGCINVATGASDIETGDGVVGTNENQLKCS